MHTRTSRPADQIRTRVSLPLDEHDPTTDDGIYKATACRLEIKTRMSLALCRSQALLGARLACRQTPILQQRLRLSQRLPLVVRPSEDEIKNNRLNQRNLEIAVRGVHLDGLVVVEDVIPHKDLDHLNTKMVKDARILQARGKDAPFNYNLGNLQQDAPPYAEYFYPSIFTSCVILLQHKSHRPFWDLGLSGLSAQGTRRCHRFLMAHHNVSQCTQTPILLILSTPLLSLSMFRWWVREISVPPLSPFLPQWLAPGWP
ncbi:hypothetical protein RRF57_005127 [Xylaria bambusicola]|uniref:Uncharacterized protein n=1 Tax=Xylaria bambusicola TaxID=326684 RepID=A0AAN7UJA2_9PEZI